MALLKGGTTIYGNAVVQNVLTVGTGVANTSTSTTTGSFQVTGGVGITGNLYIGGNIVASGIDLIANAATQSSQLAGANAAIVTANTAMKAYVDAQIVSAGGYGNTQVQAFLPIYGGNIGVGNVIVTSAVTYSNGVPLVGAGGAVYSNLYSAGNLTTNLGGASNYWGTMWSGNVVANTITTNTLIVTSTVLAIGSNAAPYGQGRFSISIGANTAANIASNIAGTGAVAIGNSAAWFGLGNSSIALGEWAGTTPTANVRQPDNSIVISASGSKLAGVASGLVIAPVRFVSTAQTDAVLQYNTLTSEIGYGNNISVTGNVSAGNYFWANGNSVFGTLYSNANATAFLTTGANITGNNVTVLGNLQVLGTTTTVFSTGINVGNLLITLANTATTPSQANGAGLYIVGANANVLYSSTTDSLVFNKSITTTGTLTANAVSFSNATYGNLTITGNMYASSYYYTGIGPVNISSASDLIFTANGWITFSSVPQLPIYTRANLISYVLPPTGGIAFYANTGATGVPVYYDGTNWKFFSNNTAI